MLSKAWLRFQGAPMLGLSVLFPGASTGFRIGIGCTTYCTGLLLMLVSITPFSGVWKTIVTLLAVQFAEASIFSELKLRSHLSSKDFGQTLTNPIKKPKLKVTHFFYFSQGYLNPYPPWGFFKDNSIMACYLRRPRILRETHPSYMQSRRLVGHNGPSIVLSTGFRSSGWSWVGFRILLYYAK